MSIPEKMLQRVVAPPKDQGYRATGGGMLSADDAGRILEIACMAVATDGTIASEELAAARVLGSELRAIAGAPAAVSAKEVQALVDKCAALRTREEQTERLRALCDALTSDGARELAYKVAAAVAMADLASSDEEFEFDIDLLDALKLSNDVADRLAGEVHEALAAEE